MLIVGLTGGMGAGKSTVARLLEDRGAIVVDVDALGRKVLERDGRAAAAVAAAFGEGVLASDGSIDRAALARVVFSDSAALRRLTAISHPAMNDEIVATLRVLPVDSIVVLDMAVLAESNLGRVDERYRYSFVVTVEAPQPLREERAVARGSNRDDVRRRMAQQVSDVERRKLANVVIVNDRSELDLHEQVDRLWAQLVSLNGAEGQSESSAVGPL